MNGRYSSVLSGLLLAGAMTSAFVVSLPAQALQLTLDSLNSTSTNSPATGASAAVKFDFVDAGTGIVDLVLTLENTTGSVDNAADLNATASKFVGFGFNLPDLVTGYDYTPNATFTKLYGLTGLAQGGAVNDAVLGAATINGAGGANTFDIGIRTAGNGNFQGGNPTGGLNANETIAVNFRLFGNGITANAIETAFTNLFGNTSSGFNAGARFQAVSGNGFSGASDKLLGGVIVEEPEPPVQVPEPTAALGLVALVGGALTLRRH